MSHHVSPSGALEFCPPMQLACEQISDAGTDGGYVLVNGKIYGSNWINNNDGAWCCVDWATGETNYETKWTGGAGKGSIISADNCMVDVARYFLQFTAQESCGKCTSPILLQGKGLKEQD